MCIVPRKTISVLLEFVVEVIGRIVQIIAGDRNRRRKEPSNNEYKTYKPQNFHKALLRSLITINPCQLAPILSALISEILFPVKGLVFIDNPVRGKIKLKIPV